jgi:hypothetical protein
MKEVIISPSREYIIPVSVSYDFVSLIKLGNNFWIGFWKREGIISKQRTFLIVEMLIKEGSDVVIGELCNSIGIDQFKVFMFISLDSRLRIEKVIE